MADNESQVMTSETFLYSLSFKNNIKAPDKNLEELTLEQGASTELANDQEIYSLTLHGVKVNKKIYQPVEIEAELDFMVVSSTTSSTVLKAPTFKAVSALLLQRQVELKVTIGDQTLAIAKNCYVYELNPQLKRGTSGMTMYVKLNIFSMDKLMTLNKYSKAYVAKKLGSGILKPESMKFGKRSNGELPLIQTSVSLKHLVYDESVTMTVGGKSKTGTIPSEFIQPYLVQYNESFYDFLVRTSNRCGEFLFFEDGKLTLGLPNVDPKTDPVVVKDFVSVVAQNVASDPFEIKDYVRDSMKDSDEVDELNHTVVKKLDTGFPKDAFPDNISSNAELSNDEYMFPLVEDKFTKMSREAIYDQPINKVMTNLKTITMGTDIVPSVVAAGVGEGLLAMKAALQVGTTNTAMQENNINPYSKRLEQSKDGKVVQFATLDKAGWTTIDYYNDIHKHEYEQQQQTICINMGTSFIPVKLGQKIKLEGLDDNYIIIQIRISSEESYAEKNQTEDNSIKTSREQIIYAIPIVSENNTERYFPPVHPVPVIRKSGPQAAFVSDNNDPKYQGRVRVAYPWQSLGDVQTQLKAQLAEIELKLAERKKTKEELGTKKNKLLRDIIDYSFMYQTVLDYLKASPAERELKMAEVKAEIEKLEKEIADLKSKKEKVENSISPLFLSDGDEIKKLKTKELDGKINEKEEQLALKKELLAKMEAAAEDEKKNKDNNDYTIENNATVKELSDTVTNLREENHLTAQKYEEVSQDVDELTNRKEVVEAKIENGIKEVSTPWIRVATPMATPGGGTFFKPQIGDEVLINYDNDNVERPYVVGSLFSKNNLDPAESFERKGSPDMQFISDKQVSMSIMSPNGHHITFTDPKDGNKFIYGLNPGTQFWGPFLPIPSIPNSKELAGGIHIGDRYGIYEIEMSSHDRYVNIKSPLGTVNIDAFTGITINAPNGDVRIVGKNVSIEAGNQVSITSGNNIKPTPIGDPDYRCGTPIWHSLKEAGWWAPLTFFANLGRGVRYGALFLGHQISAAAPAVVNDILGPAAFADLSMVRHMFEIAVKPVDGTMLIKSKRYLKLEAGTGMAKIKADRFSQTKQINSVETFYVGLIDGMKTLNAEIDRFFDYYKNMKDSAYRSKSFYDIAANAFLKDAKDPDVMKIAFKAISGPWKQSIIDGIDFTGKMKDEDVDFKGKTYHGDKKEKQFKTLATPFGRYIHGLHKHVEDATGLLDDYPDDLTFKKAAKDAFKKIMDPYVKEWKDTFGSSDPTDQFLGEGEDLFLKEVTRTLVKRKTTALYLINVEKSKENQDGKFLSIGFNESDVTDGKVKSDYNWKNFMTHFDHIGTHGNKALIYLLDGLWEPIKNRWKNPFGAFKESDIWSADKGGQILFSDNDGATLHIEGEGLKSESQSNLGNRDQLLKLLLSIK